MAAARLPTQSASTADSDYSQVTIDLAAYSDGASHTLMFDYDNEDAATDGTLNNINYSTEAATGSVGTGTVREGQSGR